VIYVIGIGVRGAESLTGRSLGIIKRAGLLVGGARHLREFKGLSARLLTIKGGLEKTARTVERHIARRRASGSGAVVVVLATGDPSLFGIADFMVGRFSKKSVEIIPNVSIVQEAFARIKEPWGGLKVLSAHGRSTRELFTEIISGDKVAVFTDPSNTPAVIARGLLKRRAPGYTVYVLESLGMKTERVTKGTLRSVAARRSFAKLNIMILLKTKGAPSRAGGCSPGIPDKEFAHSGAMITKADIRVLSLSRMRLEPASVVWDIGSCSGSVAVEAALFARSGSVLAVEKDLKRVKDILRNRQRFKVWNLEVITGAAPGCLKKRALPDPDAVFVGGGGKDLPAILGFVAGRVKSGGSVVVNAVTIETAFAAFAFFADNGFSRDMTLVNVAKAKALAPGGASDGLNMLSASNPVFIITGIRR
jgi:precorrin-6Y C5,15-methyltransferase (decarboxylating)